LTYIFLSPEFYRDYAHCQEIEQKATRPYVQVCVRINGHLFAVPMRSHIKHPHVLWTDKANGCGLDFSKAVVLEKEIYIDSTREPHIRQAEFDSLRGKEYLVKVNLEKYIKKYKEAKARQDIPRNRTLCQCSALQYFEQYL